MTLAWIGRTLLIALNLLQQLLGFAANSATTEALDLVKTIVTNTQLAIQNLTYGLSAAYDQRVDIIARLTVLQASIDAVPSNPQRDDTPVILPTVPPSGYGGPGEDLVAAAVWSYHSQVDGEIVAGELSQIAIFVRNINNTRVSMLTQNNPPWLLSGPWTGGDIANTVEGIVDQPDPTTMLSTDVTATDWLNRIGGIADYYYEYHGYPRHDDPVQSGIWMLPMTQVEFVALRDGATASTALVPPIWPGLLKVTLSTPVAIAVGLTITEPMDGVIVNLTSEPSKSSFFTFDDISSYRNLGALSFFTDDDAQEPAQSLGFTSAIYSPKTMVRAAGVKLRTVGGVVGTVTPWTIT